jgi:hypothetical protein
MRPSPLLTLLATLAAFTASAQGGPSLAGGSRISVQGGWRYVSNGTFYDTYYALPQNQALERAPQSHGGPLAAATFAYSITDLVELGIDLFGLLERPKLTNQPPLTTAAYGALVGLRFQGWLDLGPEGTVPFLGILTGPMLATAVFKGEPPRETLSQAWAGTAGAIMHLSPQWGLTVEFRQVFARGAVGRSDQQFGSFNAGGSWLTVGVNYAFPPDPGPAARSPF